MSQPDRVKVELLIPEAVNRAIKVICETFNDDPQEYMVRAIEGMIDADIGNNFESFNRTFTDRIKKILES